ncbi:UNVERIFIED_CONTAM: Pyridoxine/pyridoxamine 5'-phosphate oxidase 2 [Sesamum angustifolium]|uniref:pyridoxal 5'-phosphate synthase n=1 Tax=Sesamum angustifolium TaxID=2727405 RepID=A0AAW2IM65_9LAMI
MGSSSAAPWKQLLLSSIQANSHLKHYSYFQLATVASNGRPSNRTVVFRGFQDDGDKILINTDNRSRKIDELKHCPFAEICWYFTESWEQFRINGSVDVIDETNPDPVKLEQREKSWFACSPKSRLQYMAPTPRLPSLSEPPSEIPSLDPSVGPVAAFCLLVLDPAQIDYLNLKSNERLLFTSGLSSDGKALDFRKSQSLAFSTSLAGKFYSCGRV